MADTDGNEWVLLDTDLTARLAILPSAMSHLYFVMNEPGSGELKIPLESNAAALIESGQFAQASYRGGARGGFFVDNIQKQQADASEGGGKWLSISGRGGLALLEDAIVWDDGTTASTREFASMTKAAILITLIDEAQARGGLAALTYDFSATDDSDSVAWTDSESYQLSVGTSVLDVLRQFAETGIDFDIVYSSGSFVLSAYKNGKGTDKSETIYFRTGVNCEEVKSDERGDRIKNVLRVAYKAGQVTITDSTSITNRRRREKLLDARLAQTAASATTYGSAILANSKDPRKGISVKIYDGVGPRVFLDYDLGDYIMLDVEGTETSYRVLGIQLDWDGKDYSNVVVELNTLLYENEIRMAQDIDWLLDQWETARDADLMEVSYWAAIGDASITYNVQPRGVAIIGDYLYVLNSGTSILKYGLKNGLWSTVVLGSLPNCLVAVGTNLYIGGLLQVSKYDTTTGTTTTVAVADTGSPLSANVSALAVNGTTLYASGQFTSINGVAAVNSAKCDTTTGTWSAMADAASHSGSARTMLYSNGLLYSVPASATAQVQAWNGTTWANIGSAFTASVFCFAEYGTDLLAGSGDTGGIFIWDGATWAVFGGGVNAAVRAIGVYLTDVYIGGSFTDAGNYVSRYSGGTWWQLESGVNALIDSLILNGQDLYVAGDFTDASGKPAQGIAAYFNNFESLADYLENASSSFNMGAAIHAATASAITDTDEVPFWEASVNALRKITWANIKATLKTYLDTLYVALTGNQTIAGIKTFSSDPIIPDEAYDATNWNGVLEPPTKNALRDKIETMGLPAGSDTQVQFNDGGMYGADAEFTYDKTYNVLEVGGTNWYTGATRSNSVQVTTETGGASSHVLLGHSYQDGTGNFLGVPSLGGDRAGGTKASPTAVLNDMGLARFIGGGYDGTTLSGTRAQIVLKSTADWTASSHPTSIEFWTTPSGSITRVLVGKFGSDGALTLTPGTPADGLDFIKFTATNAWTLQQSGTGSTAMLELFSDTADKYFRINPNSNTAGGLIVGDAVSATPERLVVIGTGNIKALVESLSSTGYAFNRLINDAGTQANFGLFGSARAGTLFGLNQAGLFAIYGSVPMVIGTTSSNDLSLGTNNTVRLTITSGGNILSPLGGIGYTTGAGGTVTQATSKATGVTLNKVTGLITMNNAALAADTTVSFTLTNSTIAATDTIILQHNSVGTVGAYTFGAQPAAGSAVINVRNVTAGSLSEAIVIRYTVIKSISA